jgi:predicted DNA-binding protein (MmcQ/YjbR family)
MKGRLMFFSKPNSTLIRVRGKMKMIVMQHEGKVTITTKHKEEMELVKVCLKTIKRKFLET